MSLSFRLLLLVLLAAAPIFAIQAVRELERRQADSESVAEQAADLAELAAAQQDRLVDGVRYLLTAVAALPELAGRDVAACSARMADFRQKIGDIAWLGAVDGSGELFCTSHPADRTINLSDRAYVRTALAERRFAVSRFIQGRITGQRQIAFALPLANGGAVLAALNLDSLPNSGSAGQMPKGAAVSFHDRDGVLLARVPAQPDLVGRPAPAELLASVAAGRRNATAIGLDGVPRVFGVAALRSAPDLFVAVGLPSAAPGAAAAARFRRDLGLSAAAFALLALASLVGAELWLKRPLARVQRALDRLAAGDLDAAVERRSGQPPEVAALAAGFDDMAQALRARDERLRESERRLADIAGNLPGVVFRRVLSPDGMLRFDYMSEGVRKLLGVEPARFLPAMSLEEHARRMSPAHRESWLAAVRASASTLETFELTFQALTADGASRWLRSVATPRLGPDGSIVWDGVTLDVSDRVAAEQALKESEARFRDVAEAAAEIIWETDADGRFTYFSDQLERITGVAASRVLGLRRAEVIGEALAPSSVEAHLADLEAHRPFRNFTYRANDNLARRWIVSSGKPIFDGQGRFCGYRGAGSDVTERMETEAQRARLAAIVEASHDAIVSWTLDGRITSWNSEAERLYGYTADEAIGEPIRMLAPPERRDRVALVLAAVADGKWFHGLETARVRKDGRLIEVSLTISPVRDAEGRILGGATIARDVTERKRAEARQSLLLAELDHRVKNMLAVLIAVFQTTAHKARSIEELAQVFEGRLMALVRAHDALAQNKMEGAALRELALSELALFCDVSSGRLRLNGEETLLGPKAAQVVGMALHELATNAAKHGALSVPDGRIALDWRTVIGERGAELRLSWRESGGPAVSPPAERGFGLTLLERGLAYELGGVARLRFEPEGVVWEMTMPFGTGEGAAFADPSAAEPGEEIRARTRTA